MNVNPAEDWRALTENYRSMSDGQLYELAEDFADLTPTAQQVLCDEMKLRRLDDPLAPQSFADPPTSGASAGSNYDSITRRAAIALGDQAPDLVLDDGEAEREVAGPVEYTWKTLLCECDSQEQAWQIREVLRRAGIESWIRGPGHYSHYRDFDLTNPRILVAADQLDQARDVIARPIPQDVVEASQMTDEAEYQPPVCPKCGAADPTLESADPVNEWKCESCGAEWADEAPEGDQDG